MMYAKILVTGTLQLSPYKDYVKLLAKTLNVNGVIRDCSGGMEIEAEADGEAEMDEFVRLIELRKDKKFGIAVDKVEVVSLRDDREPHFGNFSLE